MRCGILAIAVLVLSACGSGTDARGSIGWDAGVGVIEIKGEGAYTVEMNNNADVALRIEGRNPVNGDSMSSDPLTKGGSLRHTASGPRIYRLTRKGVGEALVTYVVKSDDDLAVSTRIEP